jgi:hypothetical protein
MGNNERIQANNAELQECIEMAKSLPDAGGGIAYNIGDGLKLDTQTNTLSVDTATEVEPDNTRPITAAAVYETVGNIEVLLGTI